MKLRTIIKEQVNKKKLFSLFFEKLMNTKFSVIYEVLRENPEYPEDDSDSPDYWDTVTIETKPIKVDFHEENKQLRIFFPATAQEDIELEYQLSLESDMSIKKRINVIAKEYFGLNFNVIIIYDEYSEQLHL